MMQHSGNGQFGMNFREMAQSIFEFDTEAAGIVSLISAERHIPIGLLLHPSRCRAGVAEARQLAMYLMHVIQQRSLTEIGMFFGRDRTTVGHACACIEDRRDDDAFDAEVTRLEALLQAPVARLPTMRMAEMQHGRR